MEEDLSKCVVLNGNYDSKENDWVQMKMAYYDKIENVSHAD